MQIVELTEDGAPRGPSAATRGRHGRRAAIAGVLGALVVGALLVGQSVLDAGHRADVRRIAALPGAVAPVPDEPRVRWSLDADLLAALRLETPVAPADGSGELYVGAVARADSSVEAAGVDAATGARRWTTSLSGGPQEVVRVGAPATGCVLAAPEPVLACLLTYHRTDDGLFAPPRRAQVVVLDARTGEVRARYGVPAQASRLAVLDGTAAVAWRVVGAVEVEAFGLLTGAPRWRTSLPVPRTGTPTYGTTTGGPRVGRVQLQSAAGLFVVSAGQELYLLTARGGVQGGWARHLAYPRAATAGRLDLLVLDERILSVVVRPGRPDRTTVGAVALPSLDDGSSDVVLTVDDGLRGRDPADGRVLWRVDGRDSGLVVIAGVAYQVSDRDLLRAVDLATGRVLWRVPAQPGRYGTGLVTDGERLYVEARSLVGAATSAVLLAYGLDGRALAQIDAPPGWDSLVLRGDVLVATSADEHRAAVLR